MKPNIESIINRTAYSILYNCRINKKIKSVLRNIGTKNTYLQSDRKLKFLECIMKVCVKNLILTGG